MFDRLADVASHGMTMLLQHSIYLAGFAAVFLTVESRWPDLEHQRRWRQGSGTDLALSFVNPLIVWPINAYIITAFITWLLGVVGWETHRAMRGVIATQPFVVQFGGALLIGDFFSYWKHRVFHARWLWPIHSVHHAVNEVDWLTNDRDHPLQLAGTYLFVLTGLAVAGFSNEMIATQALVRRAYSLYTHANVPWGHGPLRRILVSPTMHRWHHASDAIVIDRNYATMFSFLDVVFGTYVDPAGRPRVFGVPGEAQSANLREALYRPFQLYGSFLARGRPEARLDGEMPVGKSVELGRLRGMRVRIEVELSFTDSDRDDTFGRSRCWGASGVWRSKEENTMSKRGGLLGIAALLMLPVGAFAELPSAEQICISVMNNDGIKVQAAQLKVNDGCVKDGVKTGSDANACIEADPKGKVAKKRSKTSDDATKKCVPAPSVFFSGPTTTNDAAEDSAKALLRDVFGPTLGALQLCDTNPNECLCQRKVINRVSKLERAIAKTWLRCKKAAMKNGKEPFAIGGATAAAQLEQCVTNGTLAGGLSVESDTKGKISDATSQIQATAAQFCAANAVVDEFAGGACSGFSTPPTLDAPGLANCLGDAAKCRFCEMVNATDNLNIDCDAWVGTTCP